MKPKSGLGIHCHHDILVEHVYDFEERVSAIKDKPDNEVEVRLKLFKMLSEAAIAELPVKWLEACKARQEASKARLEASKARQEASKARQGLEAYKAWWEECKAWQKAEKAWREAKKAWLPADKEAFHAKWCGCKNWDGEQIIFKRR